MISNNISTTETVRNVFIIDPNGVIRLILTYPMNVGRCIPEILRSLDALQIADCNQVAVPANWVIGEPLITTSPTSFKELLERETNIRKNQNGMSWYLSFQMPKVKCEEK